MDFLEPHVLEATPMGHDPVIEGDARIPASEFAHLKTSRGFAGYIQTTAVAVGSEKDVVAGCGVNGLEKSRFKPDCSRATLQLRRAKIFEPVLRAFDRVERHLPPVLHLHPRRLAPGDGQITADIQVAAGIDGEHLREVAAREALQDQPGPAMSNKLTRYRAGALDKPDHSNGTTRSGARISTHADSTWAISFTTYALPVARTGVCAAEYSSASASSTGRAK